MSAGEHCGVVLSVVSILEEHSSQIPDTFAVAQRRSLQACDEIRDTSTYDGVLEDRNITEHAAAAMIELVFKLSNRHDR